MRKCFGNAESRIRLSFTGSIPLSVAVNLARCGLQRPRLVRPLRRSFSATNLWYFRASLLLRDVSVVPQDRAGVEHSLQKAPQDRGKSQVTQNGVAQPKDAERDPKYWVELLEKYLPRNLNHSDWRHHHDVFESGRKPEEVLAILQTARQTIGVDILVFMVLDERRHKAAMCLAELLIEAIPADEFAEEVLPSNIQWPVSFGTLRVAAPVDLRPDLDVDLRPALDLLPTLEKIYGTRQNDAAFEVVWPFLAELVISSTAKPPDDAKEIMSTVHQVLARIHNLGLVPKNVYKFSPPRATTGLQYPPILHLLTSRILTTLSDAVWRAHQDEAVAQAVKEGKAYGVIVQDAPGGRFRLKVRELGPEVWLEFILWCCVEGGFAGAGARIINTLHAQSEDPWYAVHWTSDSATDRKGSLINWEAVKRRQHRGGTVGLAEAYSLDAPLAEMPSRTISAEVVLALADCLVNQIQAVHADNELAMDNLQASLVEVVSFLEPHGLAPAYFDYLAVRCVQNANINPQGAHDTLRNLVAAVAYLRTLQRIKERRHQGAGLDFDHILDQSQLEAGILHQVLQAYINANIATKALDTFTDIQMLVDKNKSQAIEGFFSSQLRPANGFFTSRPNQAHTEFSGSYGQLPPYKLASVLNMATEAKLFGLGDWLLYSKDIDGPLLPRTDWRRPSVASAVSLYAAAKRDPSIFGDIITRRNFTERKPTVNLLRWLTVSQITLHDWDNTIFLLEQLRPALGGGYSPTIVATLAATIIRLEASEHASSSTTTADILKASEILSDVLKGRYDTRQGVFRTSQVKTFQQQVGLLLRVMENVPNSAIPEIVAHSKRQLPVSNSPILSIETFNILFDAIVEVKGILEGQRFWDIFCEDPLASASVQTPYPNGGDLDSDAESQPATGYPEPFAYIPFVSSNPEEDDPNALPINPVVIPNMRTLQILVKTAVAEKQRRLEPTDQIDEVLQWAQPLYRTFNLSNEDIESEFRVSPPLPEVLLSPLQHGIANRRRKRARTDMREKTRPDVGQYFTSGSHEMRRPGMKPVQRVSELFSRPSLPRL